MHGTMNRKSSRIDLIWRGHHYVSFKIHFYQNRGRDLFKHHAVRIDQEMMVGGRHTSGDVREDKIVPPVMRH